MKKKLSLVLVFCMMLSVLAVSVFAATEQEHDHAAMDCPEDASVTNPEEPLDPMGGIKCPRCGDITASYTCGASAGSTSGSHFSLLYGGTCTFTIDIQQTDLSCSCGYSMPGVGTHYCKEYHECPSGVVDTCIAGR